MTPAEHQWALRLSHGSRWALSQAGSIKPATSPVPPRMTPPLLNLPTSPMVLTVLWLIARPYRVPARCGGLFNPKFLLVATPAFCLLVALGIRRVAGAAPPGTAADSAHRRTSASVRSWWHWRPLVLATAVLGAYYHDQATSAMTTGGSRAPSALLGAPATPSCSTPQARLTSSPTISRATRQSAYPGSALDERHGRQPGGVVRTTPGSGWCCGAWRKRPQRFVETWLDSRLQEHRAVVWRTMASMRSPPAMWHTAPRIPRSVPDPRRRRHTSAGVQPGGQPATGGDVLQLTSSGNLPDSGPELRCCPPPGTGTPQGQRDSRPGGGLRPPPPGRRPKPSETITAS